MSPFVWLYRTEVIKSPFVWLILVIKSPFVWLILVIKSLFVWLILVIKYCTLISGDRKSTIYPRTTELWYLRSFLQTLLLKELNISHFNISHKVKLEEWGTNPLPSDYEADMLTIWLKARAVSQAASSLSILIGILQYITSYCQLPIA